MSKLLTTAIAEHSDEFMYKVESRMDDDFFRKIRRKIRQAYSQGFRDGFNYVEEVDDES